MVVAAVAVVGVGVTAVAVGGVEGPASPPAPSPAAPLTRAEPATPPPAPGAWASTAGGPAAAPVPVVATRGAAPPGSVTVPIDERRRYQQTDGFGVAITDSSAQLIWAMPPQGRRRLLAALFSETAGAGLSLVRVTMGASDFSPRPYTYDDVAPGGTDPSLSHFALAADPYPVLPVLRQILAINPAVRVIATPWTAPAWMKTSGNLDGGRLDRRWDAAWASYFVRFLDAYRAAGVPVWAVSVDNEPDATGGDYPTMAMGAPDEASFVSEFLGPAFRRAGLRTLILAGSVDWNDPGYDRRVLDDPAAAGYLAGTAWHCYGGSPAGQDQVHDAAAHAGIWVTECSSGAWGKGPAADLSWGAQTLLVGSLTHWARAVVWWNAVLDPAGGPHDGGCGECQGALVVDPRDGSVTPAVGYDLLAVMGRAVRPGAVRVASPARTGPLRTVAFVNPGGSRAVLLVNTSGQATTAAVTDRGTTHVVSVPPGGIVTALWPGAGTRSANPG